MPSSEEKAVAAPNYMEQIAADPDFLSEILVAEYKTLRDEIIKKMDHRTSLVVCSVTVSSAVLGFRNRTHKRSAAARLTAGITADRYSHSVS
jgi:hypothetical protein